MSELILAQADSLGNYLAIWKLIVFLVFLILWAWVGQWMDKDTIIVRTNRLFWNYLYLGIGTGVLFLWVFLPMPFMVGFLLFLVAWLTLSGTYVMHRNARMPSVEHILTADHMRYLLSGEGQDKKSVESRLVFYSSHGNELPMPHRQESEYDGYAVGEELLYGMVKRRVSEAKWALGGEGFMIYQVVDGVASPPEKREREDLDLVVSYLKAVAGLDVKDRRKPQQGEFAVLVKGEKIDWRIKTAGSTQGEQVTLDRLDEFKSFGLDTLGFNPVQLKQMEALVQASDGVVLVSGPKGSGVSTTLYGLICSHDAFVQNIHTLEKTSRCDLDNITQNFVDEGAIPGSSAKRLQSVLLTDPDAVMVGFCDDPNLAKVGTGSVERERKKFYFGFSAPSVFHCLQRWLGLIDDNNKVAKTLLGITNQRLVRKLCPECRQAYVPNPALLKKLNLPTGKIKHFSRPPTEIEYDKHGNPILCETCQGTGYYGLTAVYETLILSDSIRKLIGENAPFNTIRVQCRKEKMMYLQEQALRKVIEGTISIQEVMRVTTEKKSAKPSGKVVNK